MQLTILKYPHPLLKQKSAPVEKVDRAVQKLVEDMFETMYAAPGVGLAAPQIGVSQRILVVDVGGMEGKIRTPDPKVLINPTLLIREGKIVWEEGCLSLPQLTLPVERSKRVVVEALDENGRLVKHLGEDLLAVAFQHEIDHLDGLLIVDRLSRLKRGLYKKKLEKMARGERVEEGEVEHGIGPAYIG